MNIEQIAETNTRDLLFFLKSAKECTRPQLAALLQCSVRQLTDYMLPPTSKAHRDMPASLRRALEKYCLETINEQDMVANGTWIKREAGSAAFVGPLSGARYPHFYLKQSQAVEDLDHDVDIKVSDIKLIDGEVYRYYTFDGHSRDLSDLVGGAKKIEEVFSIDPDIFNGWISIIHAENMDQVEGFMDARMLMQSVIKYDEHGTEVVRTPDGLFLATMHDPDESPAFNGLIILKSKCMKLNPVLNRLMEDYETIVIKQDGTVVEDGEEYMLKLAGYEDE